MKGRFKSVGVVLFVVMLLVVSACVQTGTYADTEVLESWNKDGIKNEIIAYVEYAEKNIAEQDRIAVFDMDGTIVCEKPVWIEMNVALNHMREEAMKKKSLMYEKLYAIAYKYITNPTAENWSLVEANVSPILMQAFLGETQVDYVDYVESFIKKEKNKKFDISIDKTFYKPMVELITYLKDKGFQVYIVSGSEEGLIWGTAGEVLDIPRDHLIGTRVQLTADYENPDVFIRQGATYDPMNLSDGKAENIYYELGARPVFACGNTVDDFAMLNYTTTNPKYKTMGMIVDHDSDAKEYKYNINDRHEEVDVDTVMKENGWKKISIEKEFDQVFMVETTKK